RGKPRLLDASAEERVLGDAALHAHRRGEGKRPGHTHREHRTCFELGPKFCALDARHRQDTVEVHEFLGETRVSSEASCDTRAASPPTSCPVSWKNNDSSERVQRSRARTATPAQPSAMTYASRACTSADTSRLPSAVSTI